MFIVGGGGLERVGRVTVNTQLLPENNIHA